MIKKLASAIREYKGHSIASALLILGEVVMEVIIPLLTAKLIDNGISKGDMKYVLMMGGLVALCCIASLFFGIAAGRSASIASTGFAKNLRHDMFEKIQSYSFRNIDKFSSSSLVTRMTTDVNRLQDAYQMLIRIALRSPGMLIFSLIMALLADSKLALIFIAAIPILALGLYFIMTKAHPIFEKMFKTYDKLNRVVQENLRGIRVVKAFVREDHETEKFKDVSGDISKMAVRAEKILAYNSPMMNMTVYICTLLITYICAKLIMGAGNEDGMSIGTMQQFLTYTMQILMSLMMLSMIFVSLVMSRASAERVVEVLNEESTVVSPENAETEVKNGEIEFKNVSFAYHEGKDCLHDVNLKIASGETIGIIGGTGSSKSTLVQLIPRLYDTTKGEVYVGGRNVKDYDVKALRDSVAMVLQKNVLFSGTIKDNLRWGNEQATDEEMKAACVAACADEFITAFPDGYDTYIEQGGSNVSGGQKQRLCIARALLKSPKILILDDSTSAVDTHTDAVLRGTLKESIPGTTKLIIAQRISSVQECDRIIVLDDGRINGVGTHEELLENNLIYKEVFESQTKGDSDDE